MSMLHDSEICEILELARKNQHEQRENRRLLHQILGHLRLSPARLTSIKIQFKKGIKMPTPGPVILTTAGQVTTASVLGFDQLGNPWTGAIPPVIYSIDDSTISSSTPNADGLTDSVAAVSNGVANLTASLTTAEGVALSDTETVTVAIPVTPPPTPVLSSIKVAFGS